MKKKSFTKTKFLDRKGSEVRAVYIGYRINLKKKLKASEFLKNGRAIILQLLLNTIQNL